MTKRQPQPRRKYGRTVAIIGAGRVGTALALALSEAGYSLELIVARHPRNAKRSAKLVQSGPIGLGVEDLQRPKNRERLLRASLILIATPDDVIAQTAVELASLFSQTSGTDSSRVALHTSGALPSAELLPLKSRGFAIGSLHPLISISEPKAGARAFRSAYFSVEGDPRAVRLGKSVARDLGSSAFQIKPEDKPLYHAAALMASPNLTVLEDVAIEMLGRCGLRAAQARKVLLPLIQSTVDNLVHENPSQALTGTFKRRDVATVRKHLAAISTANLRDALAAYIILGQRSLRLATAKADERTREIDRLLRIAKENLPPIP